MWVVETGPEWSEEDGEELCNRPPPPASQPTMDGEEEVVPLDSGMGMGASGC
ncbi:unnamed protein product, partial [Hydatigera taeniaeformis]|uniref:Uncharacterized protein n=1 Tax=Hydatigena taeniaeformis TaxID=6205 RepID=A0A0R3XDJ6_HYDTA